MSVIPTAPSATAPSPLTPTRRRAGRHRLGAPGGVRATDLPAVRARMEFSRTGGAHRRAFLRWLHPVTPSGRHTWSFLAGSGGRPRTAFAIILSL